jgi:putative transposase
MARPIRIEYPGAWYHVTCRGNERKVIFSDDLDRAKFLEILAKSAELYGIEVHAYVLMDNHFHFLLMSRQPNLKSFMQRFNTAYTVNYNRRHQRSGHLYQGRYKAIVVDSDSYLLELSRYVHLNPVRIKKYSQLEVEEKVKMIRTYTWSSYPGYVSLKHRQSFVTHEKILAMVGKGDDRKGRKRYEQFVLGGIVKDMNFTFWQEVKGQAVLGSNAFTDWIYERFLSRKKADKRELPGLKDLETGPETVQEIARHVSLEFDVPPEQLYQKRSPCRVARSVFMDLCCFYLARKMSLAEVGRRLGDVSVAALTQNSKRLSSRIENDSDLRRRFDKLTHLWSHPAS